MSRRQLLHRLRDERGMSIIELMIASAMGVMILLTSFQMLDSVTKTERGQEARRASLIELRQAMTQLTRDLRQATYIDPTSDDDEIKMTTLTSGTSKSVRYRLVSVGGDLYELRRQTKDPAAAIWGDERPIVTHMVINTTANPDPPFCYSFDSVPTPGNVAKCIDTVNASGGRVVSPVTAIRVTFAKDPEFNPGEPVTLATDVQLRNL